MQSEMIKKILKKYRKSKKKELNQIRNENTADTQKCLKMRYINFIKIDKNPFLCIRFT